MKSNEVESIEEWEELIKNPEEGTISEVLEIYNEEEDLGV